jgi:hypothetical protein
MPAVLAGGAGFCAVVGFEAEAPLFVAFESEDGDEDDVAEGLFPGGVFFLFFAALWLFLVAFASGLVWSPPVCVDWGRANATPLTKSRPARRAAQVIFTFFNPRLGRNKAHDARVGSGSQEGEAGKAKSFQCPARMGTLSEHLGNSSRWSNDRCSGASCGVTFGFGNTSFRKEEG